MQAFYFTYEAYDIFGESLASNDWIGAFNGDVCVGARKWDLSLCQGGVCDIPVMDNNLVSFYILPSETSLISVLDDIQSSVLGVIGEGTSAQFIVDQGGWVGSLTQFNTSSGYWLYMGDSVDTLDIEGVGIDPNKQYDLHVGLNLISFPVPGSVGISEGIPDDIEELVPYIISEVVATA